MATVYLDHEQNIPTSLSVQHTQLLSMAPPPVSPDNIDMLNLSIYSRKTLSDWLQMAQQSTDILRPLPCWLVEHVVEAHDAKIKNDYLFICSICKKGIKKPKNTILLECGKKICKECYERI
jgi:hypothetical protein